MSSRLKKVSQSIQQHLADIVQNQVSDPRLSMISITEVRVTPDLRHAHVYYHVIGLSDAEQIQSVKRAINKAAGFIRSELAHLVTFKYLPALQFHYDDLSLKSERMTQLIDRAVSQDADLPKDLDL